jgi:hypothetical protein
MYSMVRKVHLIYERLMKETKNFKNFCNLFMILTPIVIEKINMR